MRLLILFVPLLIACAPPATNTETRESSVLSIRTVGVLEERDLDEASGLARSGRDANVMWVINDDGPSEIHAIDSTGADLGHINIKDAKNNDWEDIASFSLHGTPYLLIADIGNSEHKWDKARLYVIEEPDPKDKKVDVAWRIDFRYPDGPRDAEAIAVDAEGGRVLILSKRDIPAVLYDVPLLPNSKKVQEAVRLGEIRSLPQPSRRDVEYAPETDDYYWQPTGMDLAADGSAAVILTYGAVYHYPRAAGETWYDTLQKRPAILGKTNNREAEAITFDPTGDAIFVTIEQRHAPLIRFDLGSSIPPASITVMTFNVQNLFDNVDDAGKDDKAYLSIEAKQTDAHIAECNTIPVESWRDECLYLDWSNAAIDHKLSVLAEAIRQVGDGRGADIIALQEVENVRILERLRNEQLTDSGYLPAILIEGQDVRGVDTAFLSKLPLAGPARMHPLVLEDYPDRVGDTRGLLEATFELPDGSLLTGYSVHFPAPFHPNEMRVLAYEHLNAVRAELPPDRNVFAAGDFNTSSGDDAQHQMLTRFVRPTWEVAHDACSGCPGTQYYAPDNNWSFLDMIFYSPGRGEKATWQIRADSVHIANQIVAQVTKDGTPRRYVSASRSGTSDHWPLVLTLEPAQKQ